MSSTNSLPRRAIAALLFSVAAYYALLGGEYTAFDLLSLAKRQGVEASRAAATQVEVDSLRALVDRLENDPATIEAVARERFGMIRDGEVLYRFVDVEDPAMEAPAP